MNEYSIRKVRFGELEACARVIRESFLTVAEEFGLTPENCPTNGAFIQLPRMVEDWNWGNAFYGLFWGGEMAGFMELRKKSDTVYELGKLSVLPAYRHRGCGRALIDFACAEASRMGGEKITIGIIEGNERLRNWYLKYGFIHTGAASFPHIPFTVGFMELCLK